MADMEYTFLAAVRFKDGSKNKFHINHVPNHLGMVREIINRELGGKIQAVMVLVEPIGSAPAEQVA